MGVGMNGKGTGTYGLRHDTSFKRLEEVAFSFLLSGMDHWEGYYFS
jgi:hypothetical protein